MRGTGWGWRVGHGGRGRLEGVESVAPTVLLNGALGSQPLRAGLSLAAPPALSARKGAAVLTSQISLRMTLLFVAVKAGASRWGAK